MPCMEGDERLLPSGNPVRCSIPHKAGHNDRKREDIKLLLLFVASHSPFLMVLSSIKLIGFYSKIASGIAVQNAYFKVGFWIVVFAYELFLLVSVWRLSRKLTWDVQK